MIIRGDKVYRSLEEQVFKNQWDIESLQKQTGLLGFKPVAQVVTVEQLPLVNSGAYRALAYGDAYAVGDDSVAEPSFKYYVKAKLLGVDGWLALGHIKGEQGEQGPKGDTGEKGPAGTIATANATVDFGTGVPEVDLVLGGTPSNRTFTFNFHNLKGQKGDKGDSGSVEVVAPEWDPANSYSKNAFVIYEDVLYQAIRYVPADTPLTPDYWNTIPDGLSSILKAVIEDYGEGTFTARDDVARADIARAQIKLLDHDEEIEGLKTASEVLSGDILDVKDSIDDIYSKLSVEPQNDLGEYNCATGYPVSLELPYTANKGDYFTLSYTESGSYIPAYNPLTYDDVPVSGPEDLKNGDLYVFNGTEWIRESVPLSASKLMDYIEGVSPISVGLNDDGSKIQISSGGVSLYLHKLFIRDSAGSIFGWFNIISGDEAAYTETTLKAYLNSKLYNYYERIVPGSGYGKYNNIEYTVLGLIMSGANLVFLANKTGDSGSSSRDNIVVSIVKDNVSQL